MTQQQIEVETLPFGNPAALAKCFEATGRVGNRNALGKWVGESLLAALETVDEDAQWEYLAQRTSIAGEDYTVWLPTTADGARAAIDNGLVFSVRLFDPKRCSHENGDCTDGIVGSGHASDESRVCDFHNNVEWAWMLLNHPVMMSFDNATAWLAKLRAEGRSRRTEASAANPGLAQWEKLLVALPDDPGRDNVDDAMFDVHTAKPVHGMWIGPIREIEWPEFTATAFATAEEKHELAVSILAFVDAGFPQSKFKGQLPDRLRELFHLRELFPASVRGSDERFYREWFLTTKGQVVWLQVVQEARHNLFVPQAYSYTDVERAVIACLDARRYLPKYEQILADETLAADRATFARLSEKLGITSVDELPTSATTAPARQVKRERVAPAKSDTPADGLF